MTTETQTMPTGLYWQGKKKEGERLVLPFQTIETIEESFLSFLNIYVIK